MNKLINKIIVIAAFALLYGCTQPNPDVTSFVAEQSTKKNKKTQLVVTESLFSSAYRHSQEDQMHLAILKNRIKKLNIRVDELLKKNR